MPYPIDAKLAVAVASSALFDMAPSHRVFRDRGVEAYRAYQVEHRRDPLPPGPAFPFVRRLLRLNLALPETRPVEVVLFSRNSPETGLRAFQSIEHYRLDITRGCFSSGKEHYQSLPAFNSVLFLSSSREDVAKAIRMGYAAGVVLKTEIAEDDNDSGELRMGFDFDGVIATDEAERVYRTKGPEIYQEYERAHAEQPLKAGPLGALFQAIGFIQKLELLKQKEDPSYTRILKTAIITARSAPAHERVVTTLKSMNVEVDELFLLGGIEKSRILEIFRPHIFFDDQEAHLDRLHGIPAVHIPFGIANN